MLRTAFALIAPGILTLAGRPPPRRNMMSSEVLNVDEQLKAACHGIDWFATMCDGWSFAELANEDRVISFKKQLQKTYPSSNHPVHLWERTQEEQEEQEKEKIRQLLPLFREKAVQLDIAGELVAQDCLFHSMAVMSGEMGFIGERIQLLFASGHIYDAVVISQLLEGQLWTPFYPLFSDYSTASAIKREGFYVDDGSVANIWEDIRAAMLGFHNWLSIAALQKPLLAKALVAELSSHCALSTDWAGHPDKVDLSVVPLRVTTAWFNKCLQKQLPELLALSNENGMDEKNELGQSFLHAYALLGAGLPLPNSNDENEQEQNDTVMTQVLHAGADPRIQDSHGFNALHLAVLWANQATVTDLYRFKDAKWWRELINTRDNYGRTPHKIACNSSWLVTALGSETMDLLGGSCPSSSSSSSSSSTSSTSICLGLEAVPEGSANTKCPETPAPEKKSDTTERQQEQQIQDRCDIDVIDLHKQQDQFDAQRFLEDYVSVQRPVLIKHAFDPSRSVASKKDFLYDPSVAGMLVEHGPFPNSKLFGMQARGKVKLSDFALRCLTKNPVEIACNVGGNASLPESVYQNVRPVQPWITLRDIYQQSLPSFATFTMDASADDDLSCPHLSIGPARAGSNMQSSIMDHSILMSGSREWWLLAPMLSFNSNIHPDQWKQQGSLKQEGLLTCVQQPGDLLFVPSYWGRGVVNLQTSVAFGCDFQWNDWHTEALKEGVYDREKHEAAIGPGSKLSNNKEKDVGSSAFYSAAAPSSSSNAPRRGYSYAGPGGRPAPAGKNHLPRGPPLSQQQRRKGSSKN
eukprot:gb/GEZN01001821.1/.p1 GENE.gb/GEZN01001821.1/~~gb/GEZN01001821.1/.p1  ORF type:complete len:805 (-),score=163.41 gb/GEZN01001821.1/:361-2775(-)